MGRPVPIWIVAKVPPPSPPLPPPRPPLLGPLGGAYGLHPGRSRRHFRLLGVAFAFGDFCSSPRTPPASSVATATFSMALACLWRSAAFWRKSAAFWRCCFARSCFKWKITYCLKKERIEMFKLPPPALPTSRLTCWGARAAEERRPPSYGHPHLFRRCLLPSYLFWIGGNGSCM